MRARPYNPWSVGADAHIGPWYVVGYGPAGPLSPARNQTERKIAMKQRKRLAGALLCCALLAALLPGCGPEETPAPPASDPPAAESPLALLPEEAPLAGSGGSWFAVVDGDLTGWGERYDSADYSQRTVEFEGARSVWGGRFLQAVLDQEGGLWTRGSSIPDQDQARDGWQYRLSDVATASMGLWHGAAVRTDGTLWTWGKNDEGQLANGELAEGDPQEFPPRQVMEGVRAVRSGSYVLTVDGDLYGIGLWKGTTEPVLLCRGAADAAPAAGRVQVLTPEGELYLADLPEGPGELQLPEQPQAAGVEAVFEGGYSTAEDSFLWTRGETPQALATGLAVDAAAQNLDGWLLRTPEGALWRAEIGQDMVALEQLT